MSACFLIPDRAAATIPGCVYIKIGCTLFLFVCTLFTAPSIPPFPRFYSINRYSIFFC
nr:MAG TPA: hypothetical protein [Caudoviricetes sp.]